MYIQFEDQIVNLYNKERIEQTGIFHKKHLAILKEHEELNVIGTNTAIRNRTLRVDPPSLRRDHQTRRMDLKWYHSSSFIVPVDEPGSQNEEQSRITEQDYQRHKALTVKEFFANKNICVGKRQYAYNRFQ